MVTVVGRGCRGEWCSRCADCSLGHRGRGPGLRAVSQTGSPAREPQLKTAFGIFFLANAPCKPERRAPPVGREFFELL